MTGGQRKLPEVLVNMTRSKRRRIIKKYMTVCAIGALAFLTVVLSFTFALLMPKISKASETGDEWLHENAPTDIEKVGDRYRDRELALALDFGSSLDDEYDAGEARRESALQPDDDSNQDENSAVSSNGGEDQSVEYVYLTFDDGPSIYTDKILDILKENDIKATFFVCGTGDKDSRLRPVYSRIVDEGHTIGMHSYSHVYADVYSSENSFEYDLDKIRNLIYNETGVVSKYYRFPGGSGNTVSKLDIGKFIDILSEKGIEYYDWNVYAGDASGRAISSADIVKNVISGAKNKGHAVILLHDTGARYSTLEALGGIIEQLKDMNVKFLPIDDDTPPMHQRE